MYFKYKNIIGIFLENPFKILCNNTIRRIFKMPKPKLYLCLKNRNWHTYNDDWFGIYLYDIFWKTKYENYCFEGEPYFQINFCGICFIIKFEAPFSDFENTRYAYWESILECYKNHLDDAHTSLKQILENNQWESSDGKKFDNEIFLTKYGKLLLKCY